MPNTPDEWLPVLAAKMDRRAPRLAKLRSYSNGNAPLPEMGRNLRASWEQFQKKSRRNYGGLACRALKNRIRYNGVRIGTAGVDDEVMVAANRIARDNRLATQIGLAVEDRLQTGVGYIVIGMDATDRTAVITREQPEMFYAETDPIRPWRARAAVKVWRDKTAGKDYALVWAEGRRQRYVRESKLDEVLRTVASGNDWERVGEVEVYDGAPPVVVLERPGGVALLEPHLDVIDGINLGKLHRLVITAMQAFRQRALKQSGDGQGLPDEDEDGNSIDYSKVFEPAPGALWELPEGIDVWESESVDIRPLLDGEKSDIRDFAALTTTPLSAFAPEGENQSAEGAANAKEGHVALAQDEIDDISAGIAMVFVHALRVENVDLAGRTVEVDFAPPALVSLSEKYAAAQMAKSSGVQSLRTIQRDILGMSPDQIAQDEIDRAAEVMTNLLTAGVTPSGNAG